MRSIRRQRLAVVLFVVVGATVTLTFALLAFQDSVNLFYEPARVVNGDAPVGVAIRAGGMVVEGSVVHDDTGLGVTFTLTDYRGNDFDVRFVGVLPGLFREGQGILVAGQLDEHRIFQANEVLAKHDENYVPPELHGIAEGGAGAASHPG